jgi:hypothetical protein
MIKEIIDGISVAINDEFGDGYDIYTESIEQGLITPSFSILCLNPTIEHFRDKRYFRTNQFCIHYFPGSNQPKEECYEVFDRLYKALETITIDDDLCRGTEIHSEIDDDVLSFFVNYDMYVYKDVVAEDNMESVDYDNNLKG